MNPSSNAVSGSHNNVQHNDMVFETTTRKGSNSENFTYTGEYISPYGRTPFPKPRPAVRKGGGRSSSLEQHGGRQSKEGMMKRRQSSSKRMQKVNSPRMAALAGGLFLNRSYSDRRALEETLESAKRVQKELEKADADKSSVKGTHVMSPQAFDRVAKLKEDKKRYRVMQNNQHVYGERSCVVFTSKGKTNGCMDKFLARLRENRVEYEIYEHDSQVAVILRVPQETLEAAAESMHIYKQVGRQFGALWIPFTRKHRTMFVGAEENVRLRHPDEVVDEKHDETQTDFDESDLSDDEIPVLDSMVQSLCLRESISMRREPTPPPPPRERLVSDGSERRDSGIKNVGSHLFRPTTSRKLGAVFTSADIQRIVWWMVQHPNWIGLHLNDEIRHGNIERNGFFPLHNEGFLKLIKSRIRSRVNRWWPVTENDDMIEDIRFYFGDEIGWFYAFCSFLNKNFIYCGLLGIVVFCTTVALQGSLGGTIYAGVMSITISVSIAMWNRRTEYIKVRWGSNNRVHTSEIERQQYSQRKHVFYTICPITGNLQCVYPKWITKVKQFFSFMFLLVLNGALLYLMEYIFFRKFEMDLEGKLSFRQTQELLLELTPTILGYGVCIPIVVCIYEYIATHLTEWENYKYQNDYKNALVMKKFPFTFLVYYGTVLIVAFSNVDLDTLTIDEDEDADYVRTSIMFQVATFQFVHVLIIYSFFILVEFLAFRSRNALFRYSYENNKGDGSDPSSVRERAESIPENGNVFESENTFDKVPKLHLKKMSLGRRGKAMVKSGKEAVKKTAHVVKAVVNPTSRHQYFEELKERMKRLESFSPELASKIKGKEAEAMEGVIKIQRRWRMHTARRQLVLIAKYKIWDQISMRTVNLDKEYSEVILVAGFVWVLAAVFPLSPVFAILSVFVLVRGSLHKILICSRRPWPRKTVGIGSWLLVLKVMSFLAIICNCAYMIIFDTRDWRDVDVQDKLFIGIAIEHALILLRFAIFKFIPELPEEVEIELKRQRHLKSLNVTKRFLSNDEDDTVELYQQDPHIHVKNTSQLLVTAHLAQGLHSSFVRAKSNLDSRQSSQRVDERDERGDLLHLPSPVLEEKDDEEAPTPTDLEIIRVSSIKASDEEEEEEEEKEEGAKKVGRRRRRGKDGSRTDALLVDDERPSSSSDKPDKNKK